MSQPMNQGSAYVGQIYPPMGSGIAPPTPTRFPTFSQMPSIGEQSALPRAMQQEVLDLNLLPPPPNPWPHIRTPEQQAQPWGGRTPETLGVSTFQTSGPPASPAQVMYPQNTVSTRNLPPLSMEPTMVPDVLEEDTVNLLATRCRQLALLLGLRDHPERSREDWISLISQLRYSVASGKYSAFLSRALCHDYIRWEFDKVVRQIYMAYPEHNIPIKLRYNIPVSPKWKPGMPRAGQYVQTGTMTSPREETIPEQPEETEEQESPEDNQGEQEKEEPLDVPRTVAETRTVTIWEQPETIEIATNNGSKDEKFGEESDSGGYWDWDGKSFLHTTTIEGQETIDHIVEGIPQDSGPSGTARQQLPISPISVGGSLAGRISAEEKGKRPM
ncbi:hypothetical protein C8R42DRAFT_730001 [Lentinula raphanica]|nr:hypothetical protein C8R42DRAFT_730001 [Lentinula raphanica]